ncbi:MAG: SufD family Fe-S cluster assembly protein, partial [Chloroflexi bacterium]|nr:SufD family Fe-S cluster assembly protein [Chloroflexota bacterium]
RARVTHEAAIGSVNRKELETLMARGLDEDDAVDIIIRGMLR